MSDPTRSARSAPVAPGLTASFAMSVEETAEALGLSVATVKRDWALARAWLYREVAGTPPG